MSTQPEAITEILAWLPKNIEKFTYSEFGNRLHPDITGHTDCSGLNAWLFVKFGHIEIGTYTGDECHYGKLITTSKLAAAAAQHMLPGDAIFYRWEERELGNNPWDHTNIYAGGDLVYNHGGPGRGPIKESLRHNVDEAVAVMVRRYIQPKKSAPTDPLEEIMAFYSSKAEFEAAMKKIVHEEVEAFSEGHTIVGGTIMGSQLKTTKEASALKAGIVKRETAGE